MKLQLYALLTLSCAVNFFMAYAYRPLLSLKKSKIFHRSTMEMMRSLSECLPLTRHINAERSSTRLHLMTLPNSNSAASSSPFSPTDMLAWLKDSLTPTHEHEKKSPPNKNNFSCTHVAGYMDYDPKLAALASRNLLKRKGRQSNWFEL